MADVLPCLLVLLVSLAASLASVAGGTHTGCAPNPPHRPSSR